METSALGIPFPPLSGEFSSIYPQGRARLPTAWVEGLGGNTSGSIDFWPSIWLDFMLGWEEQWWCPTLQLIYGDVSINGGFQSHGGTSKSSIYGWSVPKTIHFGVPLFKETSICYVVYVCAAWSFYQVYDLPFRRGEDMGQYLHKKKARPEMQTP